MMPLSLAIANARGIPGTAGVLVSDARGAAYLLSNHHVVFGDGARPGDPVWAVPPADGPVAEREVSRLGVGVVGRIGRVTLAGETYFVDCALIELRAGPIYPPWLQSALAGQSPPRVATPAPGMRVFKTGSATGVTAGVLVDVAYPDYPTVEGRVWTAPGQLLIDSSDRDLHFSAPGDSGAPLLDELGRVVGLLWGSNANGQGVACPIEPVLDCLGVMIAPAAPGRRCE